MNKLSHLDDKGQAHMVDVSAKEVTFRSATARARVMMQKGTVALITSGAAKKGDVLATARIAGIQAAKKTSDLIPLCHPLMISKVAIQFEIGDAHIDVQATVKVEGKTGVEMEALTACSVACLALYDMVKAVDRGIRITDLRLVDKSGGKSGHFKVE
jgi:cyclic pyranopterin monophosphate synthase